MQSVLDAHEDQVELATTAAVPQTLMKQ